MKNKASMKDTKAIHSQPSLMKNSNKPTTKLITLNLSKEIISKDSDN